MVGALRRPWTVHAPAEFGSRDGGHTDAAMDITTADHGGGSDDDFQWSLPDS